MDRKRFERRFLGFLLFLLVGEITLLALHLGWGGFRPPAKPVNTLLAGHVVHEENELRRRSTDSLIWEKSGNDDAVYYYDSVLTLAQSTATLKLFKDTEIHLSENTLVTVEPPDSSVHGEIRLRFSKGGFKARNPSQETHVETDSWSMDIKSGSEVDLHEAGGGALELDVKQGDVEFHSEHGSEDVGQNQLLRLANGSAEKMNVNQALSWVKPPPKRIYTHDGEADLDLSWRGDGASSIVVETQGREARTIPLRDGEKQTSLSLPLGIHKIYLRSPGSTSEALEVEVWASPLLHLISPLPRNRAKVGEPTDFVWMSVPGVRSYIISIDGAKTHVSRTRDKNSYSAKFDYEDDLQWSVEGVDADGFKIPPLYSYPLFIREAPLAAPRLRAPVLRAPLLRAPAGKKDGRGASFWLIRALLPEAQAEEPEYQAIFSWEPVEDADNYIIEISETPDFRKPLLTKIVGSTEYVWRRMPLQTYYWRVAAGGRSGRLGMFSEPEKVDLANPADSGVLVSRIEKPAPKVEKRQEVSAAQPGPASKGGIQVRFGSEEPKPKTPVPEQAKTRPPKFKVHNHTSVEWRPAYVSISSSSSNDVHGSLSGDGLMSFAVEAERQRAADRMFRLEADYTQLKFSPDPQANFPLQNSLNWTEYSLTAAMHTTNTHVGYGGYGMHTEQLTRSSSGSVSVKDSFAAGVTLEGLWCTDNFEYLANYYGVIGMEYGAGTTQRVRLNFGAFSVGAQGAAWAFYHTGGHTYEYSAQAIVGVGF